MKALIAVLLIFSFSFTGCLNTNQNLGLSRPNDQLVPVKTQEVENPPVESPSVKSLPIVNTGDGSWQLRADKEGIPVYTRKVDGSPILEYKASAIVDAPIKKAVAFFEDEKQISRWYYQCVHSELVEHESPRSTVIYLVLHLPWPVAPRDFVFRRSKTTDTATGIVSYNLTALPQRIPLVKGIIRVNSIKSLWVFKPLPNNKTEVFFQQHTDPAGSVPASIINGLAAQTPFFTLKSFRDLLTVKDGKS